MKRLTNRERNIRRFVRYMEETAKNKLYAIAMAILGVLVTIVAGDATALMFLLFVAVPLFFAGKNVVY